MTQPEQHKRCDDDSQLTTARHLITFANIAGPISVIIGGVALSTAALVCALIARTKINKLLRRTDPSNSAFRSEIISATKPGAIAIIISVIALVLNAITIAIMMPVLIEVMNTGNFTSLFNSGGSVAVGSATSTWG